MSQIICTFSPGRTGTGFLSQAFGFGDYAKRVIHKNGSLAVTHEEWSMIKELIFKIKKVGRTPEIRAEILNITRDKISDVKSKLSTDDFFITDHRIGRYFAWAYIDSDIDYKVIRVERNIDDVVKSLNDRMKLRKESVKPERYDFFLKELWSKNHYHPSDIFIQDALAEKTWGQKTLEEQLTWYVRTVDSEWFGLRDILPEEKRIVVNFKDLISGVGLDKISEFISYPYSKEYAKIRANK